MTFLTSGRLGGIVAVLLLVYSAVAKGGDMSSTNQTVNIAKGGGRWFPAGEGALRGMVNGFIDQAEVASISGRVVAAIAPHAGYVYSGKVAGHTFRALRANSDSSGCPDVVVVLGFTHKGAGGGVAIMDGDALVTPLGAARLDRGVARLLTEGANHLYMSSAPHLGEHSAENIVPFLQVALPDCPVVLALMENHREATLDELVERLVKLGGTRKVLVVASTDLLHDPDYQKVTKTDKETLARIERMDWMGTLKAWDYSRQICCGIGPVIVAMRFADALGSKKGVRLCYRNSGDDFPESRGQWVVGYGALVFPVTAADGE